MIKNVLGARFCLSSFRLLNLKIRSWSTTAENYTTLSECSKTSSNNLTSLLNHTAVVPSRAKPAQRKVHRLSSTIWIISTGGRLRKRSRSWGKLKRRRWVWSINKNGRGKSLKNSNWSIHLKVNTAGIIGINQMTPCFQYLRLMLQLKRKHWRGMFRLIVWCWSKWDRNRKWIYLKGKVFRPRGTRESFLLLVFPNKMKLKNNFRYKYPSWKDL